MSAQGEAALAYAARGAVLPLAGKVPRLPNGVHGATRDAATVREWWRKWPDAGVGLRTGESANGRFLVVIDVDGEHGADALHELEAEHGTLPNTPRVKTPRGEHYWFVSLVEVRNSVSALGPGLDVRGAGGYVVAPPSPGYEWDVALDEAELAELPDWLRARLQGLERPIKNGSRATSASSEPIPEGRRNAHLASLAGCRCAAEE